MQNSPLQRPIVISEKTMIPIGAVLTIVVLALSALIWIDKNYVSQTQLEPLKEDIAVIKVDVKELLRGSYNQSLISETK